MRKFKLIKDYPGCPVKLNDVVINDEINKKLYFFVSPTIGVKSSILEKSQIENYPEFWQEIKQPRFEIVSLINTDTGIIYTNKESEFGSIYEKSDRTIEKAMKIPFEIYEIRDNQTGEILK